MVASRANAPLCLRATLLLAVTATLVAGCEYIKLDENTRLGAGEITPLDALANATTLDHTVLSGLLTRFVALEGDQVTVDYDGIRSSPEAANALGHYRAQLASVEPSKLATPAERLAYWINGYNASVIAGVLDAYQGDHGFKVMGGATPGLFGDVAYQFSPRRLGGQPLKLSLDQVEHLVVRGRFDHGASAGVPADVIALLEVWHRELWPAGKVDARVHAALNPGARGAPNLLDAAPRVYRADLLEQQLEAQTRGWLDAAKGAGPSGVSQLFEWYREDFVTDAGSVEAFFERHRTKKLEGIVLSKFLVYDWSLNIAKPR